MSTYATDPEKWAAKEVDQNMDYPSATISGIVPDQAHLDSGGYHVSIEDLLRYGNGDDYSYRDSRDRNASDRRASAGIDISMNEADQKKNWYRWEKVFNDRAWDTRAKYFREYIGWNGKGSAERLDFGKGTRSTASADHKWHSHRSTWRIYVNDWMMAKAMASIDRGETHEQWNAGNGGGDDDVNELQDRRLASAEFRLHHMFQLDPTVEGDPFGGTYDLKLVTKLLELFDDVADLKEALAALRDRPAATVEMTAADHDAIAERVAARLGTLRFADPDGPDQT